ncbi:inactive 2'-5' oligoadenylate synthetase 1C-like isoform X1 [Mus caroli]|uniref:Inactive 2'-5' oligoadenylate synthetase 1C-like isoform X1 n=1 Tax=Mus caroli TaxID=10089 RepID=A0A6P5PQV8_MUSCR|nr:inactive 2'-5' oligoadenylate synthetase 1C-like isoform X1 [Mus caroli]
MAKNLSSTRIALCSTPAWRLDKFIEGHLLGDITFLTELRTDVNSISAFLKERCFQGAAHPVRISRVVMGGSYNRYTMLKGRSEVDLLVFFNNLTCFDDQFKLQKEVIEEIQKHLCQFQQEKRLREKFEVQSSDQPNFRSLSFKLSYPKFQQEVEFHMQTAYDALYEVRRKERRNCDIYNKVYARLIRECTMLGKEGEFNICFMELQQDFLWKRPCELKNLICLVKHWYQLCKEKLREPLPPQYALELLTVYAWEHELPDKHETETARGFRTVLELITKYLCLRIYWTLYYDVLHEQVNAYLYSQVKRVSPLILDPADPTWNVAGLNLQGWCILAEEAKAWLDYPCFKNRDGSRVSSWDVPPERKGCVFL